MVSKIQSLTFMLLLTMLFSGVAHSSDQVIGINGKLVTDGRTSPDGIYYGYGYGINNGPRNIFIGGILQESPDPDQNDNRYKTFADQNQAIYVPTYYSLSYLSAGNPVVDTANAFANKIDAIIADSAQVNLAATGTTTPVNGLESAALQNQQYNTIIGYSGGTATAITALLSQNVTCDTLILISPMKGTLLDSDYKNEITKILTSGCVNHIEVIWSPQDTPTGPIGLYEAQITSDWDSMGRISVYRVDLPQDKNNGWKAHIDIFFDHAMNHIKNGVYVVPASVAGASIGSPVNLTLCVYVGGISSKEPLLSVVPGAQVIGQDGLGNSFQQTTDSDGYVTITGMPGTWSFTVSAPRLKTNSWSQDINITSTSPVILQSFKIALTLNVHNGNANGPVISGAQITGQDGFGDSFQETTDNDGYVTITGVPGTWSFTASASGFETNSWDQEITESDTKDAYLQATQPQQSIAPTPYICAGSARIPCGLSAQQQEAIAALDPVKDKEAIAKMKDGFYYDIGRQIGSSCEVLRWLCSLGDDAISSCGCDPNIAKNGYIDCTSEGCEITGGSPYCC